MKLAAVVEAAGMWATRMRSPSFALGEVSYPRLVAMNFKRGF